MKPRYWLAAALLVLAGVALAAVVPLTFVPTHLTEIQRGTPVLTPTPTTVPTPTPTASIPVPRPAPAVCIKPGAVSEPYANTPFKEGGKYAFGPAVDRSKGLSAAKTEARVRLCGKPGIHGPDERLWASLDNVLNRSNPNARVGSLTWVNSVNDLVLHRMHWSTARLKLLPFPDGSSTFEMVPGPFPLIESVAPTTHLDWFLVVDVQANDGRVVTLALRLRCGLQPYLAFAPPAPPWPSFA